MFRSSAKPGHPYSTFGTGNLKTLHHPSIRDDLIKFYRENYSANIMKLCLYGRDEIDVLESLAYEFFEPVKNLDIEPFTYNENPFGKE